MQTWFQYLKQAEIYSQIVGFCPLRESNSSFICFLLSKRKNMSFC